MQSIMGRLKLIKLAEESTLEPIISIVQEDKQGISSNSLSLKSQNMNPPQFASPNYLIINQHEQASSNHALPDRSQGIRFDSSARMSNLSLPMAEERWAVECIHALTIHPFHFFSNQINVIFGIFMIFFPKTVK